MTACTFEPAGSLPGPDATSPPDPPGTAPDATPQQMPDARPVDALPPVEAFCDPDDASLVGCFAFEDTAESQSGAGLVVSESDLVYAEGVRGRALDTRSQGALHIEETAALDFDAFTIEMWVHPDQLPTGSGRASLFDNDGQYSVFVFENAAVRCSGNGEVRPEGALAAGTWTHVACVHDGQSVTLYIDGQSRATGPAGLPPRNGGEGSNIAGNSPSGGDRFAGRIDELRIWSRARTAAEICATAGCTVP